MNWEIKTIFIGDYQMAIMDKILNDACGGGWEPYGIDRSFHYFKRVKEMRDEGAKEVSPTPVPVPRESAHTDPDTNKRKRK